MKAGKEYELLIANMYRSLEPNAEVTHDDYILDKTANAKRQIDVSIKYKIAGVDILIIVQAKDYKHKADVLVVDQFNTVINDTKANKGILICSKGFTKAALTKAEFHNIECLTIHSALNKKWETLLRIPVKRTVHAFDLVCNIALNVAHKAGQECTFVRRTFSYDGINIIGTADIVKDHIFDKLDWNTITRPEGVSLKLEKGSVYHSFDNEMIPVEFGLIELKYKNTQITKFYVEPSSYIYEKDHINKTDKIHDHTISKETLEDIVYKNFENEEVEDVLIDVVLFDYNDGDTVDAQIIFNTKGNIDGNFFIKGNVMMNDNEISRTIVEFENLIKSKSQK
ncbi:restriction endonuclease [Chryseobacterium proteolyticum]|uniref:restriction endonuclease n=1 Tax=Chryseobacterium proteolyticum TaxID=118127 RepID=UPI003983A40A